MVLTYVILVLNFSLGEDKDFLLIVILVHFVWLNLVLLKVVYWILYFSIFKLGLNPLWWLMLVIFPFLSSFSLSITVVVNTEILFNEDLKVLLWYNCLSMKLKSIKFYSLIFDISKSSAVPHPRISGSKIINYFPLRLLDVVHDLKFIFEPQLHSAASSILQKVGLLLKS